jgi:acyl-CoA reductase-like NAD-dependent aldehyde dehydrogenase
LILDAAKEQRRRLGPGLRRDDDRVGFVVKPILFEAVSGAMRFVATEKRDHTDC